MDMDDVSDVVEELANKYLKWWKRSSDGKNIYGACPFHSESSEGAFYMSLMNGLFICHSCQTKGSLFTFLKEVKAPRRLRESVMKSMSSQIEKRGDRKRMADIRDPFRDQMILSEAILGIFDYCPKVLLDAGFDIQVLKKYDVGFDKQNLRITFPIRNHLGLLVGIAGRTVIDESPRYKNYTGNDLAIFNEAYANHRFEKRHHLWNMHNIYPLSFRRNVEVGRVVVVEGYKAALWMIQNGFKDTVAIMGTYLSSTQQMLLQRLDAEILIFLDNTDSARKGVMDAGLRLRRSNRVRVCTYPTRCIGDEQPDSLNKNELIGVVESAQPFSKWRRNGIQRRKTEAQRCWSSHEKSGC